MSAEIYDILCVGGGAAGFFGAISCAEMTSTPLTIGIVEGTARPLTKVKISGGGRCNVTHNQPDPRQLVGHYPRGGKSLTRGFFQFGPKDMAAWLQQHGVPTKVESDGRMFPQANTSQAIVDCFESLVARYQIHLLLKNPVKKITQATCGFQLDTKTGPLKCRKLLLATGSSPAGHKLCQQLGHTITPLAPSLFTLKSQHPVVGDLAGVSVKDCQVKLILADNSFQQQGPVLITHWGFSGPAVLKLSAFAAREFAKQNYQGRLEINWLPGHNWQATATLLREERTQNPRKTVPNSSPAPIASVIPKRLWQRLAAIALKSSSTWAEVSNSQIESLCQALHKGSYDFSGKGEFKEEFVTCGGIALPEVDLTTFASKVVPHLYLAGELLDVDGITGGFNFQNAWTSSRLAAKAIVASLSH